MFTDATFRFLEELAAHNDKVWFDANKEEESIPSLNLAPFGRWTLRDEAAQRRLALRWGSPE